jgi:hypothetical protein
VTKFSHIIPGNKKDTSFSILLFDLFCTKNQYTLLSLDHSISSCLSIFTDTVGGLYFGHITYPPSPLMSENILAPSPSVFEKLSCPPPSVSENISAPPHFVLKRYPPLPSQIPKTFPLLAPQCPKTCPPLPLIVRRGYLPLALLASIFIPYAPF